VGIYVAGAPQVPGFVYAITATQFVLFFSFALNMALQYREVGRWRDYVVGEVSYITLSLLAKSERLGRPAVRCTVSIVAISGRGWTPQ